MGEIALSAIAGPVISSVLQDVMGSSGGAGGSGAAGGGGGLFDSLIKNFTSAFQGLFSGNPANMMPPAAAPPPYSSSNFSPATWTNPGQDIGDIASRLHHHCNGGSNYGGGENGGPIVRDHRHPEGGRTASSYRQPITWGGPTPLTGDARDAQENSQLNAAQSSADSAEQNMLAHPDDKVAQLEYEKAEQALQNMFTMFSEQHKEQAQSEEKALQASVLN
jgi:hypothetical protein